MCSKRLLLPFVMLGFMTMASAQNLTVTGSVTDAEGFPMEGAAVVVKGTSSGTTTNPEGRFELSVPQDAILVAS